MTKKKNDIIFPIIILAILAFRVDLNVKGEVIASQDNPDGIEVVILKLANSNLDDRIYFFYVRKQIERREVIKIKVDSISSSLFDDTARPGIPYQYEIYISHDRDSTKSLLITTKSIKGIRPVKP